MNKNLKIFIPIVSLGLAGMIVFKYLQPLLDEERKRSTSDAGNIKDTINIGTDSWVGYFPLCSKEFRKRIPRYMLRHKVPAGMTGWAQINGWRGDTSIDKRIECDLYYIEHWSLFLDLKIMILTLFRGFRASNAY